MPPKRDASGTDADVPAKKQKTSGKAPKAPKAESTALVEIDPNTPTMIYMVIDKGTGKVLYIGQSVHAYRRFVQHKNSIRAQAEHSSLGCYCARRQRAVRDLEFKPVPGLPNGVAHRHADAFEAYYISKYDTLFNMLTNPDGCNLTVGNHANKVDVAEIKRQLAEGYKWPEPAKAQVAALEGAPTALKDARFQEAVLTDLDARANTDPEKPIEGLAEALGEARLILGRMEGDGLYEHVHDVVLPKYEDMAPYDEVPRSNVVAELNDISDRANEVDEELGKAIRWEGKALLLDHWREVPLTANEVVHKLRVVLGVVNRFAESRLDLTPPILEKFKAARIWSSKHDYKAPSGAATRRHLKAGETFGDLEEEATLGHMIANWKSAYTPSHPSLTGRPFEASVKVLLRDFPELLKAIRTKDEIAADNAARDDALITFLKQGLADEVEFKLFPNECAEEGLQKITAVTTGRSGTELKRLRSYLGTFLIGSSECFKETLRAAADDTTKLTHARVKRIVEQHEANEPNHKAEKKQSEAVRIQRKHAHAAAAGKTLRKYTKRARDEADADAPELDAPGSEGEGEDE